MPDAASDRLSKIILGSGADALSLRLIQQGDMGARSFRILREDFDPNAPQGFQQILWEGGWMGSGWKRLLIPASYLITETDQSQGTRILPAPRLNGIANYPLGKGEIIRVLVQSNFTYVIHETGIVKLAEADILNGSFTSASENWTWGSAPLNAAGVGAAWAASDRAAWAMKIDDRIVVGLEPGSSKGYLVLQTVNTPPTDDVWTQSSGNASGGVCPIGVVGTQVWGRGSAKNTARNYDIGTFADSITANWSSAFTVCEVSQTVRHVADYGITPYFITTNNVYARTQDGTFYPVHKLAPSTANCPNWDLFDGYLVTGHSQGLLRYAPGSGDSKSLYNPLSEDSPSQGRVGPVAAPPGEWLWVTSFDPYFYDPEDGQRKSVTWLGKLRKANERIGDRTARGLVFHTLVKFDEESEITSLDADLRPLPQNSITLSGSSNNGATGTSVDVSHTVTGSDRFMVVIVSKRNTGNGLGTLDLAVASSFWNSGSAQAFSSSGVAANSTLNSVQMLTIAVPNTGAGTVRVTNSTSVDMRVLVRSYTGVGTISAAETAAASNLKATDIISSDTTQLVVDGLSVRGEVPTLAHSSAQAFSGTVDNTSKSHTVTVPALSYSATVVAVHTHDGNGEAPANPTGVTVGGTALTAHTSRLAANTRTRLFTQVGIASGSKTMTITFSAADGAAYWVEVHYVKGVSQSSSFGTEAGATGTSTAPSVAVGSVAGDLVLDAVSSRGAIPTLAHSSAQAFSGIVDNTSKSHTVTVPSLSYPGIVVAVHTHEAGGSPADATGVTVGGTALTAHATSTTGNVRTRLYTVVGVAAGSKTMVITFNTANNSDYWVEIHYAQGVAQSGSFGAVANATGTSTAPSVAVGSAAGDLVIDGVTGTPTVVPPVVESVEATASQTGTTLTRSVTVPNVANRYMVVMVYNVNTSGATAPPSSSSVDLDGVPLTAFAGTSIGSLRIRSWRLIAPAVGGGTLTAHFPSSTKGRLAVYHLSGVDQASPAEFQTTTADSSNDLSFTASATNENAAAGQLVIDGIIHDPVSVFDSIGAGQTELYRFPANDVYVAGSRKAGAKPTTMSWSFTRSGSGGHWAMITIPIRGISTVPTLAVGAGQTSIYNSSATFAKAGSREAADGASTTMSWTQSISAGWAISGIALKPAALDGTAPTLTVGAGQTEIYNNTTAFPKAGSREAAGGVSTTMSWTLSVSAVWAISGIALKPAVEALPTVTAGVDQFSQTNVAQNLLRAASSQKGGSTTATMSWTIGNGTALNPTWAMITAALRPTTGASINRLHIGSSGGLLRYITLTQGDISPLNDQNYLWAQPSSVSPHYLYLPESAGEYPNIAKIPYWLTVNALDADANRYLLAEYELDSPIWSEGTWVKVNEQSAVDGKFTEEGMNKKMFFLNSLGEHKMTSFISAALRFGLVNTSGNIPPQFAFPISLWWLPAPDQAVAYEIDVDLEPLKSTTSGGGGDMAKLEELLELLHTRTTLTSHGYGISTEPVWVESVALVEDIGQLKGQRSQKKATLKLLRLETS